MANYFLLFVRAHLRELCPIDLFNSVPDISSFQKPKSGLFVLNFPDEISCSHNGVFRLFFDDSVHGI